MLIIIIKMVQDKSYLKDANYSFEKGKTYAIVGASGSGKTTSLVLAGGLDKPKEGHILYKGEDIAKIGFTKYRCLDVSIVFQSYNLITYMNADSKCCECYGYCTY